MEFPLELRYTETHEWAKREGNRIRTGITEYAQHEISDVVFVELPKTAMSAQQPSRSTPRSVSPSAAAAAPVVL